MEIDTSHYLEAIKLLRDLLGGLCVGMVCIGGWIIYVTRWKASVDSDLKALKEKNPVSEKDCIASHENCEKHISSEFGHGSAKFKEIQDALEKARTEMREDMKAMETRLSGTITGLLSNGNGNGNNKGNGGDSVSGGG